MTRALIVIDMQRGCDDEKFWGRSTNPGCEANVAALLDAWQQAGEPMDTTALVLQAGDFAKIATTAGLLAA